jgi:oligopeptide/dipeptide ABC transporter ATP-binding protein
MTKPLMQVVDVSRNFGNRPSWTRKVVSRITGEPANRIVHALDHVSLDIQRGEVLGLVGESGCGKSTLGRIMSGILPPSSGGVTLDGQPVMTGGSTPRKNGRLVQMVFQNPFSSLNPRIRIGDAITEGPVAHGLIRRNEAKSYAREWLDRVGLDPTYADRLPHQFSGGQRQRVAIARALAMQPEIVVCDEPVASLDVSIQAQIINLFMKLKQELGLTMLFISHDLGVVKHLCDRVAVMYLGRIVEIGKTADIYAAPAHPYTRGLLDGVPELSLDAGEVTFRPIIGELPSPLSPPAGCHFRTRCPHAQDLCRTSVPQLGPHADDHRFACHFPL